LISFTVTPASLSSLSSSVSGFFFAPNNEPVLNNKDDLEVGLGFSADIILALLIVVSDFDLLAGALKNVFNPDFLGAVVAVEVVVEEDEIVIIGSDAVVGVVAIEAFPEDKELYVPDFDEAAAVALAIISAIIS
jgi:hypothetical protein